MLQKKLYIPTAMPFALILTEKTKSLAGYNWLSILRNWQEVGGSRLYITLLGERQYSYLCDGVFAVAQHSRHRWQVEFLGAERIIWPFLPIWDPILWFSPWYCPSAGGNATECYWWKSPSNTWYLLPSCLFRKHSYHSPSFLRLEHPFCKILAKDQPRWVKNWRTMETESANKSRQLENSFVT